MPDRGWYQAFVKDWDGDPERSGWNRAWVDSLPDPFSAESVALSYQFMAELQTMPLAPCEAALGCPCAAGFHLDLHGCWSGLICEYHASEWMQIVLEALNLYGGAFCDECRLVYKSLAQFMEWRFV